MDPVVAIQYDTTGKLQYRTASGTALGPWITVGKEAVNPIVTNYGAYTDIDTISRLFPISSQYLVDSQSIVTYLQGRCWWLLEEMAKYADTKLSFLRGCLLAGELPGSPAHHPCSELGGGMMADCKYPVINFRLDISKMQSMVDKFLLICAPVIPGKEYLDISNESEVRMGSDVFALIGGKYITGSRVNQHIKIDDDFHHRFDDPLYPHFHIKWSVL